MLNSYRAKLVRTVSPALTLAMLLGAARLQRTWPRAADAATYHERVRAAVARLPMHVGTLAGEDIESPPAALDGLAPSVERTVVYDDQSPAAQVGPERTVTLGIVDCTRVGDVLGHVPSNVYPAAFGDELIAASPRDWRIAGLGAAGRTSTIRGTEYQFVARIGGEPYRRTVYNFLIVPRRGILPDMKELAASAEDYHRRYFGAAQVQVTFASREGEQLSQAARDAVFERLLRAAGPAIDVLRSGE